MSLGSGKERKHKESICGSPAGAICTVCIRQCHSWPERRPFLFAPSDWLYKRTTSTAGRCKTDRQHNFYFHTTCCQTTCFGLLPLRHPKDWPTLNIHDLYLYPQSPVVTIRTTRVKKQQLYVQSTQCIDVFCVDLRINSEYLPTEGQLTEQAAGCRLPAVSGGVQTDRS